MKPAIWFEKRLVQRLVKLNPEAQILFCLHCCECALANYVVFCARVRWGRPDLARAALDMMWDTLATRTQSPSAIEKARHVLEKSVPDPDDFEDDLTGPAQDAIIMVLHTIDFYLARRRRALERAVQQFYGLLDARVGQLIPPPAQQTFTWTDDLETAVAEHPVMQAEIRRQTEITDFLATSFATTPAASRDSVVRDFRARAMRDAESSPLAPAA